MIDTLLNLLQRPALWQRSEAPFWDDEHISKGMLEAHLNPDWDAASRKAETIERSVAWLGKTLPAGGRVLDLGCGPGLYAKRLSALGFSVTGMDLSERSIAYARAHDPKSEYIVQSYLELDVCGAFDAALLIYCDYAALTAPERRTLLANVRRALKPGGMLILDVYTDVHFSRKAEQTSWTAQPDGGFWSAEGYVSLDATYLYENGTVAAARTVVLNDKGAADYIIWDTAYTKARLEDEVRPSGFSLEAVYDDVCASPYTGASETLCAVLRSRA